MNDNKTGSNSNPFANEDIAKDSIASEIVGKTCRYGENRLSFMADNKNVVENSEIDKNAPELKLDKCRVVMCWNPKDHGREEYANGRRAFYKTVTVLRPNEVCNEAHLIIAAFDTKDEANNLCAYLKTKFVIFLVAYESSEKKICKTSFIHVPVQDFSKPWTDAELYKEYELEQDEIAFIESNIKPIDDAACDVSVVKEGIA